MKNLRLLVPVVLIISCAVLIKEVSVLIAYDCENTNNNYTIVSIQDVAPCPDEQQAFNHLVGSIQLNGTTTASLKIMGTLKDDSTCEGTSYHENGHSWTKVIVVAAIKIHTRDYLATVKLNENELSLINGVTYSYVEGYCMDSTYGETVWDYSPDVSCDGGLTNLFRGPAAIIANKNHPKDQILVVEQGDKIFALSLIKTISLCGFDA